MEAEMILAAYIAVGVVAALHLYFLVMEMFFWDKPLGRRVFGLDADFARASKTLAANQGLYNGFLAAGLIWGLTLGVAGHPIIFFFLGCVIVAGIFGGLTANRKIIFAQALPGAVAMALLWLS
jgi:putative membrane protein